MKITQAVGSFHNLFPHSSKSYPGLKAARRTVMYVATEVINLYGQLLRKYVGI